VLINLSFLCIFFQLSICQGNINWLTHFFVLSELAHPEILSLKNIFGKGNKIGMNEFSLFRDCAIQNTWFHEISMFLGNKTGMMIHDEPKGRNCMYDAVGWSLFGKESYRIVIRAVME
jgi:hypothetical protein